MKFSGAQLNAVMTIGTIGTIGALALAAPADAGPVVVNCSSLPSLIATVHTGSGTAQDDFRIRVDNPAEIKKVCANYDGTAAGTHPNGLIVYAAPGERHENTGYSWYLRDVHMVDVSMELCDGTPTDVEQRLLTSTRYCPWSGRVIAVTAAPPR